MLSLEKFTFIFPFFPQEKLNALILKNKMFLTILPILVIFAPPKSMPWVPVLTYFGIENENEDLVFLFCFLIIYAFSGLETINK